MSEDIVIIDLGIGNLANVEKALDGKITSDVYDLEKADKIVLPGVGNFGSVMKTLQPFKPSILDAIEEGKPFLGICLGMQLLFEKSEESEGEGLGAFNGNVRRFRRTFSPHIGWNQVREKKRCDLLKGIDDGEFFYFVHSYHAEPKDDDLVAAITDLRANGTEIRFPSIICRGNTYGVQFHPEKSSRVGLKMLNNFKDI